MAHAQFKHSPFLTLLALTGLGFTLPSLAYDANPEAASGFTTGKTAVAAKKFMAATANPLATNAAYDMLAKGGSAVDAAVAAQMVLGLTEPQSSGIGGGAFLLTFDGKKVEGLSGEPIAAALHAAGVRSLRHSSRFHRPRGLFCAIGNCSSCLMTVDGVPNVRVCVEPLRAGMQVETQAGKGKLV